MGEGKAQSTGQSTGVSTPETMDTYMGGDASTHGANTNLDPAIQGGPITEADRAATRNIEQQHVPETDPE